MGLFSLVDALMDRPLEELLEELTLADDIVAGLLGADNLPGRVHRCAVALEAGEWDDFEGLCTELGLDENALPDLHRDAITDARQLCAS